MAITLMKVYLSYPMTVVCSADLVAREELRNAINTCDFSSSLATYDPEIHEPQSVPLSYLQELDIQELSSSDVMLVCFSKSANSSKGVSAEIEWAKRFFNLPVIIYLPEDVQMAPWTVATLSTGDTVFCRTLPDVISQLRHILPKEHHDSRAGR